MSNTRSVLRGSASLCRVCRFTPRTASAYAAHSVGFALFLRGGEAPEAPSKSVFSQCSTIFQSDVFLFSTIFQSDVFLFSTIFQSDVFLFSVRRHTFFRQTPHFFQTDATLFSDRRHTFFRQTSVRQPKKKSLSSKALFLQNTIIFDALQLPLSRFFKKDDN